MKAIQVTPAELRMQASELDSLRSEYESLFSNLNSVLNKTNAAWSENLSHNFVGKITSTQKSCSSILEALQWGSTAAAKSADGFESIDSALARELHGNSSSSGGGNGGGGGGAVDDSTELPKASWWDRFKDAVRKGTTSISTGVAKVVDDVKNVVSGIVEDYKNKGITWKIIKTAGAVASTIGAVVSVLAAWGITAGSAGLATPLAVIVTTYAANSVISNFSDLYNCWFGDPEQVGNVNLLKTGIKTVLGEPVGTLVYNVGSLTSTIASISALVGKVKQAPDMLKALKEAKSKDEFSIAVEGTKGLIKDIFSGRMSLSELPVHLSLLNLQLENIQDLSTCVGLLSTVGTTTKKLADGVAEAVIKVVNPNATYESSIIKNIFGEDSFAGKAESVYNEITGITSSFEKDQYKDIGDGIKGNQLRTAQ